MKVKVGIFFGGPSREREISFAGGRTVYDNLNQTLFEAVPIFIDSHKNFIQLDWEYIYKGSIRDFYPPVDQLPDSPNGFQIYLESLGHLSEEQMEQLIETVGRRIPPDELPQEISVAFLALHGEFGEDGQLQRMLEELDIPYTGSGIQASEIGMDKAIQKELMLQKDFECPKVRVLERKDWLSSDLKDIYEDAIEAVGFPLVIRPANQGSSIGVSIIEHDNIEAFREAVNNAFFRELIPVKRWKTASIYEKNEHIRLLTDIRVGVGFPLDVTFNNETYTIYHPEQLLSFLNKEAEEWTGPADADFLLEGHHSEEKVILEEFINGQEFSCIVIRKEDGSAVALPPTEIVKGNEVFDYRSKYMPGFSRKVTPIRLPAEDIEKIRKECERLFVELGFETYARIDGFFTEDKKTLLNDPNTTSGMLPSSFFFHQAAEIGLNPSQFLTYIIRASLQERLAARPGVASFRNLLELLDDNIQMLREEAVKKQKIGVFLGGYSFERHISVESGRNIFEKLSSSDKYEPIPVFLTGSEEEMAIFQLPINLLLKDNADDIRDKIHHWSRNETLEKIKEECYDITQKYASAEVVFEPVKLRFEELGDRLDFAFIALHGRPGEDGYLQKIFEKIELPYNGSGVQSSEVTIDKYKTLQVLSRNGFVVTDQLLAKRADFESDEEAFFQTINQKFDYPFVAKPVDDGCSSAVKVIRNEEELKAYVRLIFRQPGELGEEDRKVLKLRLREEFPIKHVILLEDLIRGGNAKHFLEITGGLLTAYKPDGSVYYEVFEPSETLASGDVLSLEEKFLAGEGQNITPARFSANRQEYQYIADQVKADLERAARILNIQGYARIDAFVRIFEDNSVETIVVEVNSLPGMTPATCIFHQAAINGYQPYDFIERIIEFGKRRFVQRVTQGTELSAAASTMAASDNQEEEEITLPAEETKPVFAPEPTPTYQPDTTDYESFAEEEKKPSFFQKIWMPVWGFLKSPFFLKNFAAMLGVLLLTFFLVRSGLNWYTHHGESQQVENFEGMTINAAERLARDRGLRLEVMDSIFEIGRAPGMVIEQTPKEGSKVKSNRTIYLVITRLTPTKVMLPDLVGNDDYYRYTRKLEQQEVNYKVREKVQDFRLEENTILYLYYNDQKITAADLNKGVKVPKGSTVEFVITERRTGNVPIPNLLCKRYQEAMFLIESNKLSAGNITTNLPESAWSEAFIVRQDPAYVPGQNIPTGTPINIVLAANRPAGCGQDDVLDQANGLEEEQF